MITLIIPTLNEAYHLDKLLAQVRNYALITQIIVVDGGSLDKTEKVANHYKVAFYKTDKGKAVQMNFGATKAFNEILLFIHADCRLPLSGLRAVPEAMQSANAGCFYLKFDKKNFLLSIYSWFSRLNWSYFTYGDQGLFIKKDTFNLLNGFSEIPILEDLELVIRLKKLGKFVKLNHPIYTSARRFVRAGVLTQQIKNIILVGMFIVGVSPRWLAKFYSY